jgi:hypothetical protein
MHVLLFGDFYLLISVVHKTLVTISKIALQITVVENIMSERRLAAVFFISRSQPLIPFELLLERAKATGIVLRKERSISINDSAICQWAGLIDCQACLHERPHYRILEIKFWQSQFLELRRSGIHSISLEVDPALEVATTFKHACENLLPEVAFIVTHTYEAESEWILKKEQLVLEMNATALADERFGLLYLNEQIGQLWIDNPLRDNRDNLPIDHGRLVFAGRGNSRW